MKNQAKHFYEPPRIKSTEAVLTEFVCVSGNGAFDSIVIEDWNN